MECFNVLQFNVETGLENLDLADQMRKLAKLGKARRNVKLAQSQYSKTQKKSSAVVTIETVSDGPFTECGHLKQVVCLLPSSNPKTAEV